MMRQLEGADGEPHEAEARRKQPHLLPHLTEAVRDPVREDAEVADAPIELEAGKQVEGGVEDARRMPLDEAVAFLGAHAGDGVEAALPDLGVEERDVLGRVLEVAVHDHVPVGTGVVDAGGERLMLAEVAAELHAADAPVLAPELLDQRPGVVGAAVVDEVYPALGPGMAAIAFAAIALGLLGGADRRTALALALAALLPLAAAIGTTNDTVSQSSLYAGCPRSRGARRGNGGEAQRRSRRRRALPRPRHRDGGLEGSGEALPARCPDLASDGAGRDRHA